ncbi:MAG TPA: hypothetical protein VFO46_12100 [Candidatus Sulfotelmatobacter sp.]|nr:hypothetical protein [Candidatus Sulfotelmatobacter sp.]
MPPVWSNLTSEVKVCAAEPIAIVTENAAEAWAVVLKPGSPIVSPSLLSR